MEMRFDDKLWCDIIGTNCLIVYPCDGDDDDDEDEPLIASLSLKSL
jgi:hypothetical protein